MYKAINLLSKSPRSELQSFFISLLSVTAFFIITLATFHIKFGNDDAYQNLISAGISQTNAPSEYLLFVHVGVGLFLKQLYTFSPSIPWYGISFYFLLYISFVLMGFALLRLNTPLILWILWLIVFGILSILILSFTIIALFLVGSGILVLASILLKQPPPKLYITCYGVAILLIELSGLMRFNAMLLGLGFFVLLGALSFLYQLKISKIHIVVLIGALSFAYVLKIVDREYYKNSPGWETVQEYNESRLYFIDRSRVHYTPETSPFFDKVHWTKNDYDMLGLWFFADEARYSKNNLDYLIEHASDPLITHIKRNLTQLSIHTLVTNYYNICFLILMIIFITPLTRIKDGLAFIALIIWPISLYVSLTIIEHQPHYHVWMPVLGITAAISLLIRYRQGIVFPLYNVFLAGILIYMMLTFNYLLSEKTRKERALLEHDLASFSFKEDQPVVVWADGFCYENIMHPLRNPQQLKNFTSLHVGIGTFRPYVKDRLTEFHIHDLYESLYTNKDILLIAKEENLPFLHTYLKEHYQVNTRHITYFKGTEFSAYRIIPY
jgi:hypothetical protein